MGQRPNELTPHESLQHYWGAELRALRTHRGMALADLAHQVHCDSSYLGKIERAERTISADLAASCDAALNAHGTLIRLHTLTESDRELTPKTPDQPPPHEDNNTTDEANQPGTLSDKTVLLPGPDASEEITVAARTADGRIVFVSVPRRRFLHGLGTTAIALTTIPATASAYRARRPAIPTDINPIEHWQQMRQVLRENDNLFGSSRVIPVVREQIAVMQQLRSSWRGSDHRALVRVEAQYSEFCGWLYQDAGEHSLAESWTDHALALSHLTEDRDLAAFTLVRRAGLAVDMQVAGDAICFSEQALLIAPRSRIAVLAVTRKAHGHALNGDYAATERDYDHACELLDTLDDDPTSPCASWLDQNYIALQRARSLAVLGDYRRSAQSFEDAFVDRLRHSRRARGVYLARAALARAGERQVERAAALGLDALAIGSDTQSGRILTALARLNDALAPWSTAPAVADFRTAMKDTIISQV